MNDNGGRYLSLSGADAGTARGIARRPLAPLGHLAIAGAGNVAAAALVVFLIAPSTSQSIQIHPNVYYA